MDDKIGDILDALGCHHKNRTNQFYTASNPDGDNKTAINVGLDSLHVTNHTRDDYPNSKRSDIITLVEYIKKLYFTNAINWICEVCGYDFYESEYKKEEEIDPCLLILNHLETKSVSIVEAPLLRRDDSLLYEYVNYPNSWFLQENISYDVQVLFEIGFSVRDECVTIPIRDELGNLVGVKGRTILETQMSKYWYPYPVPKTKILYGLDKSYSFIQQQGRVYVFESEKSVLKAFSMGVYNCVSIGGHELSDTQVLKLERLGVDIVLALDKDVDAKEVKKQADKFLIRDRIYCVLAFKNKGLLEEKDSPTDRGFEVFNKLIKEDFYKVPA